MIKRVGRTWYVVVATFVVARLALYGLFMVLPFASKRIALGDLGLYEYWHLTSSGTGAVPDSTSWMYPPGAAFVLAAAGGLPGRYSVAFPVFLLILDALVLAALLWKGSHRAGSWMWAVLPPLLGAVTYARLDIVPVAATVVALLWATSRPRFAGAVAAVGVAVKAWPVLLGLVMVRNRAWLAGAGVTGGVVLVLSLLSPGAWSFVGRLSGRGLQVESVPATPWLIGQVVAGRLDGDYVNGTFEILDDVAAVVASVATVLVVAGVALAWWVSRRWEPAVRWWAIVLVLLTTSLLLSAQFVVWLVGATAVAASIGGGQGRPARRAWPLLVAVVVLTHLAFPGQWEALTGTVITGEAPEPFDGSGRLAALTLTARNLALAVLTTWTLLVLHRGPTRLAETA